MCLPYAKSPKFKSTGVRLNDIAMSRHCRYVDYLGALRRVSKFDNTNEWDYPDLGKEPKAKFSLGPIWNIHLSFYLISVFLKSFVAAGLGQLEQLDEYFESWCNISRHLGGLGQLLFTVKMPYGEKIATSESKGLLNSHSTAINFARNLEKIRIGVLPLSLAHFKKTNTSSFWR